MKINHLIITKYFLPKFIYRNTVLLAEGVVRDHYSMSRQLVKNQKELEKARRQAELNKQDRARRRARLISFEASRCTSLTSLASSESSRDGRIEGKSGQKQCRASLNLFPRRRASLNEASDHGQHRSSLNLLPRSASENLPQLHRIIQTNPDQSPANVGRPHPLPQPLSPAFLSASLHPLGGPSQSLAPPVPTTSSQQLHLAPQPIAAGTAASSNPPVAEPRKSPEIYSSTVLWCLEQQHQQPSEEQQREDQQGHEKSKGQQQLRRSKRTKKPRKDDDFVFH